MGKGVSCLGIGKRIERGGLSVKGRREERGKEGLFGGWILRILELERELRKFEEKRKRVLEENLERRVV